MPERKTLNEDLFYRGSSANLPRLHTCENKVPFWDFSQFAVTQTHKQLYPKSRNDPPHFHITNLIKELNILLELLRESLTNLTTKLHAEPDPKKNLHPHSNETEDPKK